MISLRPNSAYVCGAAAPERGRPAPSSAQLPQTLVQDATALKARMFATCEYCLDDDASIAELASIRSGNGYDDLKHDLRRLAVLYRDQQAELAGTKYDPDDNDIVYGVPVSGGLMKLELSTFDNHVR